MSDVWPPVGAALFAGAGVLVGSVVALISVRLPMDPTDPPGHAAGAACDLASAVPPPVPFGIHAVSTGRRRLFLMAMACALIGVCADLARPGLTAGVLTALLGWQLLLVAVVDGEHFWLPDQLTMPLLASGGLAAVLLEDVRLVDSLVGAGAGFAALWLTGEAYRRVRGRTGLGDGDPYLLAAGGAWVGWAGLPSVLVWAASAGLSIVLARMVMGGRVWGEDRMPFGVFLAIGIWMTWLFGPIGMPR